MATLRTRRRENGSLAYLSKVRIKRDGDIVRRESRKFTHQDKEATNLLKNTYFERVGWFRNYQQDTALLLLLTSAFSFDRGK